ncbi:unnamed protein product [Rotaria magnacalcarata]|uniref:Uncharacterized protein n=1 Tax=Rotaria magnacalcarata TaxID=392030 RepID=A0A816S4J4_9BILA|nr:unnamed protein product [Rotaria magnacalcarata]
MYTSTATFRGEYAPYFSPIQQPLVQAFHPSPVQSFTPEKINVSFDTVSNIPSGTKTPSKESKYFITFKIFGIGSLGITTAMAIALGIIMVHFHFLWSPTTTTVGTTIMTTTTTTATTTTSTTSVTTTTTTTTTTTATTTQSWCKPPCICAGVSSYSLWLQYSTSGMYMNIDTSSCHFNQTPTYITSIDGTNAHFDLVGHNAIYVYTSTSFRIYVTSRSGLTPATMLSYAASYAWNVNWVGMYY